MATSKIVLEFEGSGDTVRFTYNYANPETTSAQIKALMTGMIANGSIFQNPPLTAKAAKIVTTTEDDFDIED